MTTFPIRSRLIEVAIDLFGRDGLNASGTRAIAEAAGAQMSAITYHFGGKEGLHLACARHIAAEMRERITPLLERTACTESDGPAEARAAILVILSGLVGIILNEHDAPTARFVVREQMNPTPAFEILFEGAIQPLAEHIAKLLRRIAGQSLTHDQLNLRAITLIWQVLALRFARASMMRVTGWESVGGPETDAVRAIVVANVNAILSALEKGPGR